MTTAAAQASTAYSYSLWYRSESNTETRDCPNEQAGGLPTAAERDRDLMRRVPALVAQGYTVYRVQRHVDCQTCRGVGTRSLAPKGWRKRTDPPWYMCKRIPCPACHGEPRTVESDTAVLEATS